MSYNTGRLRCHCVFELLITESALKALKYLFFSQPKLTDEKGWKRFCLGEKTYLGSSEADQEPALDYSKVVKLVHYL